MAPVRSRKLRRSSIDLGCGRWTTGVPGRVVRGLRQVAEVGIRHVWLLTRELFELAAGCGRFGADGCADLPLDRRHRGCAGGVPGREGLLKRASSGLRHLRHVRILRRLRHIAYCGVCGTFAYCAVCGTFAYCVVCGTFAILRRLRHVRILRRLRHICILRRLRRVAGLLRRSRSAAGRFAAAAAALDRAPCGNGADTGCGGALRSLSLRQRGGARSLRESGVRVYRRARCGRFRRHIGLRVRRSVEAIIHGKFLFVMFRIRRSARSRPSIRRCLFENGNPQRIDQFAGSRSLREGGADARCALYAFE